MEPRVYSCLDRPWGLLLILAGAPISHHPPGRGSRFEDQLSRCHLFPLLHIPVVAVVVELQVCLYKNSVRPVWIHGLPRSNADLWLLKRQHLPPRPCGMLWIPPLKWDGSSVAVLTRATQCAIPHSLQTLEAVATFQDSSSVFATAARQVSRIHH